MEEIQVVSKNTFMVGLREVILKLTGLLTFPIIARSIGVSTLGILGTAQAFTGILFLVSDLGLNKSLIKEVAQNREEGDVIFSNALVLKTVSLVVAALIGLLFVIWSGLDELTRTITILVIALGLLVGLHDLLKSLFSAYEKMEYLPLIDGFSKGSIVVAVIVIFVVLKGNIIEFQLCSLFITLGVLFLSLHLFLKKVHRIKLTVRIELFPSLLRMSIPFMMVGLFAQTFGAVDSLMLAAMLGRDAVGLYQIAYKFVVYCQLIPATISTALFPTLSRLFVEDYAKFEYGLKRCFKYLLILSIPLAMSLYLMAHVIIETIFGRQYMGSVGLLQVLVWTLIFIFMTFPIGISLGVSGNQKCNVIAVMCGSSANIIMNYIFIGYWGIYGVAISTILTASLVFFCSMYFFRKVFPEISIIEKRIWFPLVAFIVSVGIQYFLALGGLVNFFIFNGLFLTGVLLFGIIDREDRAILWAILRLG